MDIQGKHIVVAGGGSGIGFAIAHLALEHGAPDAALFALTNPYLTGEVLHVNGGGSLS